MKDQEVTRFFFFLLFYSKACSIETTIYTRRQKSFIYFTLMEIVHGSMWRKNWTHVFLYLFFFFVFNGIVFRKNNKKDWAYTGWWKFIWGIWWCSICKEIISWGIFCDTSGKFPWPNVRFNKLLQHVCKTTAYFLVVSNKEFSLIFI